MLCAAILAVACALSTSARAATVTAVRAERRGPTLELHFATRGTALIHLTHHGDDLYLDFDHTRLALPARPLLGAESPPLQLLRAIDDPAGHCRLVIQVSGKTDYALARLPKEIILRLAPAGTVPDLAAPILIRRVAPRDDSGAPASATNRDHAPARLLRQARVVIDPGHGGRDPGARDATGRVLEKHLALQIAQRLAAALEARGASVTMTRDRDVFVSLPDRTRIANRAHADLFVSIHLNASSNPETAGLEVYYLNNTTDRAALRLARIENGTAAGYGARDGVNLNYILNSLRRNYKADESASLARLIEAQTVTELNDSFGLGVRPLGAWMGPFYVLVGAEMPAVLVECGFLSNPTEAARLTSAAYQGRLADGIADAVVRYLNSDLAVGNL